MADLAALKELYAWMRDANVPYAKCGELELRLGSPAPSAVVAPVAPADDEPDDAERRDLEMLLYSSGAEAEPFLRAMRHRKSA